MPELEALRKGAAQATNTSDAASTSRGKGLEFEGARCAAEYEIRPSCSTRVCDCDLTELAGMKVTSFAPWFPDISDPPV